MDVLTDDHEREEVVRKWWHENWLSLTEIGRAHV